MRVKDESEPVQASHQVSPGEKLNPVNLVPQDGLRARAHGSAAFSRALSRPATVCVHRSDPTDPAGTVESAGRAGIAQTRAARLSTRYVDKNRRYMYT